MNPLEGSLTILGPRSMMFEEIDKNKAFILVEINSK